MLLLILGLYLRPKPFIQIVGAKENTLQVLSCAINDYGAGTASSPNEVDLLDTLTQLDLCGPFPHNGTFLNVEQMLSLNLSFVDYSGKSSYALASLTITDTKSYLQIGKNMYVTSSDAALRALIG